MGKLCNQGPLMRIVDVTRELNYVTPQGGGGV